MSANFQSLSFTEKLNLIRDTIIAKPEPGFENSIFTVIESRLHISIPEPLKEVYRVFGNQMDFLDAQYHIAMPDDLSVNGEVLVFVAENQFACFYGVHLPTLTPVYMDYASDTAQQLDQSLTDFLLFLLGLQCTAYAGCVATAMPDEPYEPYLSRISDEADDGAVFCRPGELIAVSAGEEVFLCAKSETAMCTFEKGTGIDINYL